MEYGAQDFSLVVGSVNRSISKAGKRQSAISYNQPEPISTGKKPKSSIKVRSLRKAGSGMSEAYSNKAPSQQPDGESESKLSSAIRSG